ncbi:MAG: hypothetical protein IKW00_06145 [Clostridia bacterium]|nr:hypothetical protein [Clostridia bacterium]
MKTFCFTVDDNIRFLQSLSAGKEESLFENPYLALFKHLHEKYDLKVQLNLFYELSGFDLSQMPDRFKAEWEQNAHWLKMSFHSRLEKKDPYISADYEEVYADCTAVRHQILRFAGEKSLGKTTTIHYCQLTPNGIQAMQDLGVQGLLGLFGSDKSPYSSYSLPENDCALLRKGEILQRNDMRFYSLDLVMTLYDTESLLRRLQTFLHRDSLRVMIHEQYFYPDYHAYQPDFAQKLDLAFDFLTKNGYESCFAEELT